MEYYGVKTEPNRAKIEFGWAVFRLLLRKIATIYTQIRKMSSRTFEYQSFFKDRYYGII